MMLPSASVMARVNSGRNVNGSGIGLEYCSEVPVIWQSASMSTSASSGRIR